MAGLLSFYPNCFPINFAPRRRYKAMHWARTTAIGCLVLIALLAILNWSRWHFRYRPRKLTAALRGLGYPHLAFIDLSLGITLVNYFVSLSTAYSC